MELEKSRSVSEQFRSESEALQLQIAKSLFDKEAFEAKIAHLETSLEKVAGNVDMATKGRKIAEDTQMVDKDLIQNLREELQKARSELTLLRKQKDKLELELTTTQSDLASFRTSTKQTESSFIAERHTLVENIRKLEDRVQEDIIAKRQLVARCDEEKETRQNVEIEMRKTQHEINELKFVKNNLTKSLEDMKERNYSVLQNTIQLNQDIVDLKEQLEDVKRNEATLQAILNNNAADCQMQIAESIQPYEAKITDLELVIQQWQMKEQDSYSKAAALVQTRKELVFQVKKLKSQAVTMSDKVKKAESILQKSNAESAAAAQTIQKLTLNLKEKENQIDSEKAKIKHYKKEFKRTKSQLEELETEHKEFIEEIPDEYRLSPHPIRRMSEIIQTTTKLSQVISDVQKVDAESQVDIIHNSTSSQTDSTDPNPIQNQRASKRSFKSRKNTQREQIDQSSAIIQSLENENAALKALLNEKEQKTSDICSPIDFNSQITRESIQVRPKTSINSRSDADDSPFRKLSQRYEHEEAGFPKIMRMGTRGQSQPPATVLMDSMIIDETPEPLFEYVGKNKYMEPARASLDSTQRSMDSGWSRLRNVPRVSLGNSLNRTITGDVESRPSTGFDPVVVPRPRTTGIPKRPTRQHKAATPDLRHQRTSSTPVEPTSNLEESRSSGSNRKQCAIRGKGTPQKGRVGDIRTYLKQANSRLKDNFEFL